MKTSDIKVGEEYAAQERRNPTYPERVRVLAVGVDRHRKNAQRWDKPAQDGIRVEVLDRETGKPTQVRESGLGTKTIPYVLVLRPVDFHDTWKGWTAEQAANAKASAEAAARRLADAEAAGARLDAILPAGVRLPYGLREGERHYPSSVRFDKSGLADLLEAVAAAAHRRALGG